MSEEGKLVPTSSKGELLTLAERFLEAALHNRPEHAGLSLDARSTYNGVEGILGSGDLWGRAVRAPMKQTFVDPAEGGVVHFAVLANTTTRHGSVRATYWWYIFRLRVEAGQITETEEIAFDGGWGHYGVQPWEVEADPRFEAILPEDERSTRAEMVAIVDQYWRAVSGELSGQVIAFHPDARRTELGQPTTDAWNFPLTPRGDFSNEGWVWSFSNIRYPVLDELRGVVVSFAALNVNERSNPDFGPTILAEVFKIECGLLRRLFAFYQPGTGVDGWGS